MHGPEIPLSITSLPAVQSPPRWIRPWQPVTTYILNICYHLCRYPSSQPSCLSPDSVYPCLSKSPIIPHVSLVSRRKTTSAPILRTCLRRSSLSLIDEYTVSNKKSNILTKLSLKPCQVTARLRRTHTMPPSRPANRVQRRQCCHHAEK